MDAYPPTTQRPPLLKLAAAIGCRSSALRRDECGDWRINGRRGHIYAAPGGFQILVTGWAVSGWNRARAAFAPFADLTNDGDDEGALFMGRLPTDREAEIIRHFVGVAKKRELSEETLARLRRQSFRTGNQKIGQKTGSEASKGAK